jgi:hypothetical protein
MERPMPAQLARPAPAWEGAAPFVVAVSGHRALHPDDLAGLEQQLFAALELIAATLPDSPLDFLSPLADGADQLFASQVLRLRASLPDPGRVRLLVPLPMALDAYCAAQGGNAPERFRARIAPFLDNADQVYQVPDSGADSADGLTAENRPYAMLGRHLAIHSHLLLALWDGLSVPATPGGTAAVVDAVLSGQARRSGDGGKAGAHWLAQPDEGYVLHVPGRRSSGAPASMSLQGLAGGGAIGAAECIGMAGRELNVFNRRHRQAAAAGGGYPEAVASGAARTLAVLGIGHSEDPALAPLARAFAIADLQAARAKRIWRRSWVAIALAAVLAGSSSLLRLISEAHGELIETLSFGAGAVIAIGVYLWIARADQRNAYLAYRSLAEGLRVQLAWTAAGSGELASDFFLRKQRGDVGWVRKCIDAMRLHPARQAVPPAQVLRGWIGDQLAYLDGPHAARRRREQVRSARWGHRLLLAGLACAVAGVALSIHHGTVSSWTLVLLIIAMKLLTDLGAAWVSFNGKMAHAETLQQMAHLRAVYSRAAAALDAMDPTSDADAMALLLALGREVLEEEGNWMRVYMERRLAWHGR